MMMLQDEHKNSSKNLNDDTKHLNTSPLNSSFSLSSSTSSSSSSKNESSNNLTKTFSSSNNLEKPILANQENLLDSKPELKQNQSSLKPSQMAKNSNEDDSTSVRVGVR